MQCFCLYSCDGRLLLYRASGSGKHKFWFRTEFRGASSAGVPSDGWAGTGGHYRE